MRSATSLAPYINPCGHDTYPVLDLRVADGEVPPTDGDGGVWGPPGWRITVEGDGRSARCEVPGPVTGDVLVHPVLSTAAVCLAVHGAGDVLHGGLVHTGAGAVALLARKGVGKTTTLAHLARHGATVLADDQVVLRDGLVHAGPRCLDLRPESADLLGVDSAAVPVRGGERRRLPLPACPDTAELRAIVVLEAGDELSVEAVAVSGRVPLLAQHRTVRVRNGDPTVLLDLARLPVRRVVRPPGRAALDAVAELVLGS